MNVGFAAPSFSYQAIVSSLSDADIISKSPSPSKSATCTSVAQSALVAISEAVKTRPRESSSVIVNIASESLIVALDALDSVIFTVSSFS